MSPITPTDKSRRKKALQAEVDLSGVLTLAAESAQVLTRAAGAAIELAEGDDLVCRTGTGVLSSSVGARVAIASDLSGLCVRTGQVQRCDDAAQDACISHNFGRRFETRSWIVVPLRENDRSIGVLKVTSPEAHVFSEQDVQTLALLSELIPIALCHAVQSKSYQTLLQEMEKTKAELAEANARLETLAPLDSLTGLKNHRVFQERLTEEFRRALRYGTPLSLVMLDVDHFKQFNDAFGHPAGDEVLKAVAVLLQKSVRECDFVARYGGEEFAVVLPQTDAEGALVIAERCRAAIETAFWSKRPITASFGAASLSRTMTNSAALLAEADNLLYLAKAKGRNQVTCSSVVHADTMPKFLLTSRISL